LWSAVAYLLLDVTNPDKLYAVADDSTHAS
jgi:hypothetical protein